MTIYFALLDLRGAILFLALVRISSGQTIPPCNNNDCCQKAKHQELDNSRRSTQSHFKLGQVPLCDKDLKAGWYRFISFVGGEMPTTKVDENRCGTLHPIWLRTRTGTHPRPSNTAAPVTVTACVNINERNGGCFYSFNVGVKFCPGNYFVYYLTPMSSCSIAYCAGKISLKAVNKSTMFEGETSTVNYSPVPVTVWTVDNLNFHLASTSIADPNLAKNPFDPKLQLSYSPGAPFKFYMGVSRSVFETLDQVRPADDEWGVVLHQS